MISTLRRGVNAVLFAVACLLAGDTANAILAAVLLPPPAREAEGGALESVTSSEWRDRQSILDRNVFESSTLAPPPSAATEVEDDLEATQLPLTLLGTAASENPRFAWAAIQDRDARSTLVVGIGGAIQDKATVVRIERRRVVLLESGVHRELTLDEDSMTPRLAMGPAGSGEPFARGAGGRRDAAARAAERRLARTRLARSQAAAAAPPQEMVQESVTMPREQVQEAMRNPAELFSQARILPKYEEGQMRGVQVSQIKPGSLFEQAGLREGDLITSLNGVAINGPEQTPVLLRNMTEGAPFTAEVIGVDGATRQVSGTFR